MPAPIALAPLAWKAAQFGLVAAAAVYAARRQRPEGPRDVWRETALNEVDEGLETDFARSADEARAGGAFAFKRGVRLGGADGPGVEVEVTSLFRVRARRL